jgi:hypothetical protein
VSRQENSNRLYSDVFAAFFDDDNDDDYDLNDEDDLYFILKIHIDMKQNV